MRKREKNKSNKQQRKKGFFRKVTFLLSWGIIGIIIIFLLIIILLQFRVFRNIAIERALSITNSFLIAKIELDDLRFNPFGDLQLFGLRIITDGDTLINSKHIHIDLDYWKLNDNHLIIRKLAIEEPIIKFIRNPIDSIWNFEKIAPPSEDTTKTEAPHWLIALKNFSIENGRFFLSDPLDTNESHSRINYSLMNIDNLNIELTAEADLKKDSYFLNLINIQFVESYSKFKLDKLGLIIVANENQVEIKDLNLTIDNLNIGIDVVADNFNFNSPAIEESVFKIDLKLNTFSFDVFNYFFAFPVDLPSIDAFRLNAVGDLNNLIVNDLVVNIGNSEISLQGKVLNLLDFDKFRYDVEIANISLFEREINDLKRLIGDLPDFKMIRYVGSVNGNDDEVNTQFNLISNIGSVSGNFSISNISQFPLYICSIEMRNFNLMPIVDDSFFNSLINGHIKMSASGNDLGDLLLNVEADIYDSFIANRTIRKGIINANIIEYGKINLDTVFIEFFNQVKDEDIWLIEDEREFIGMKGFLDISNHSKPQYNLVSQFEALNLYKIFRNSDFPNSLTGNLSTVGSGFHIDSLETQIALQIEQSIFKDRVLLPFQLDILFRRDLNTREFRINSDFGDAMITGVFSYSELIPTLAKQVDYLVDYFEHKLYTINPEFVSSDIVNKEVELISQFPKMHFNLDAEIKNLATFSFLLSDIELFLKADIKLNYSSDFDYSKLDIENISVRTINIKDKDLYFTTNALDLTGKINFVITDSITSLRDLDIKAQSISNMIINELTFRNPNLYLKFSGDLANFDFSTTMNDDFFYSGKGYVYFKSNEVDILFDTLTFASNDLIWQTNQEILAKYSHEGLIIEKLSLYRESAEKIELNGTYRKEFADGIKILITHFPIKDIDRFSNGAMRDILPDLKGDIDSLTVRIEGSLDSPIIDLSLKSNDIELNSSKLGLLKAELQHNRSNINGKIWIEIPTRTSSNLITIDVFSLPIDLSLGDIEDRFHNKASVNIRCKLIELPMAFVQPFVTQLEELRGSISGELNIYGQMPDKLQFVGYAGLHQSSFVLSANNLKYYANGRVRITTDEIIIENINLNNAPEDLSNGTAFITGTIKHREFNPNYLDISISTPRFMLLSDASVKSMPTLYGKFIIATGPNPLRFWGSFAEPNLDGDISILRADLKMPDEFASRPTRSAMMYEIRENYYQARISRDTITSNTSEALQNIPTKDIADLINYDLRIRFVGQFILMMSISGSQLIAYIGTQDRTVPIRYVKLRDEQEPRLYGDINVKDGSVLKLYKVFSTRGNVYFPTGSMIDPGLDLIAEYSGKTYVGGNSKTYLVRLNLTGTKNLPNMSFTYFLDGVEQTGDSTSINENALFLLMTGKTKQELFESGSAESDIFRETFTSLLSTETSKALSDLLSGTEVIQSADINFEGGDFQTARLRLTGRLFGDISWELGGTVADLANNNTFSIDVPLASLLNTNLLNMNVQVSTTTNFSTTNSIDQKNWEIKIKIGGNW